MKKMPPGWPTPSKDNVKELTRFHNLSEENEISKKIKSQKEKEHEEWQEIEIESEKSFGDILCEISEKHAVSEDRLVEFFRIGAERFDFR
jgi:ribosomal protein S25